MGPVCGLAWSPRVNLELLFSVAGLLRRADPVAVALLRPSHVLAGALRMWCRCEQDMQFLWHHTTGRIGPVAAMKAALKAAAKWLGIHMRCSGLSAAEASAGH